MQPGETKKACQLKYFKLPNYWEELTEEVTSADQLLRRLQELQEEYRPEKDEGVSVYLENSAGDVVQLGLGSNEWVVITHRSGGECFVSLGDEEAEGYKPFLFPEWTELSRKHLIPSGIAREVVRRWFETGTFGDAIKWTV
jgi:hypothetical protein